MTLIMRHTDTLIQTAIWSIVVVVPRSKLFEKDEWPQIGVWRGSDDSGMPHNVSQFMLGLKQHDWENEFHNENIPS